MKQAIVIGLYAVGWLLVGQSAQADEPAFISPPETAAAAFDDALSDADLSGQRGGATISNLNDLEGALYGNSAVNTVSGGNIVTEGSLAGSTGVSTLIQNSGNNVLIQNAMILNLQVQ